MPEGERIFHTWKENVAAYAQNIEIPLVLKEVGFGMDVETIVMPCLKASRLWIVSGRGGLALPILKIVEAVTVITSNDWGQSTVQTLLQAQDLRDDVEILASGGVRNPLDMVKCLVLGAKGVGLSRTVLDWWNVTLWIRLWLLLMAGRMTFVLLCVPSIAGPLMSSNLWIHLTR